MKLKKALIAALSATVVMAAALGMAACDGGAATQTGAYLSENNLTYSNFLPQYNYFTATSTTQQLDTFDDDTYCLTITTSTYSNIKLGPDVPTGEETWNDRGQTITRYYGTCTVEADPSDETLSFVTISTPTRVVYSSFGSQYFDTDNWTQTMTDATAGEDGSTMDAAAYLTSKVENFPASGIEIMVNLSMYSFDQVSW